MATSSDLQTPVAGGWLPIPQIAGWQRRLTSATEWLVTPTSILPLVIFRIAFGVMMFAGVIRFAGYGWIEEIYLQPQFHFKYLGFEWVQVAAGNGMYWVFGAMALTALMIAAGAFYRFSMVSFFLLFTYVELLDKAYYLNHYYFISILSLILIFLPLNRAFSVDSLVRPTIRKQQVQRWTIWTIRLQLGMVYFFAGVAKLNPDWMYHALPLRMWLPARSEFPVLGPYFLEPWFAFAMSWAGAAYDLTIPFFLSTRRLRPFAYIAVIGFHFLTGMLFKIGMFPWVMIACTLIFFEAQDYRNFYNGVRKVVRVLPRWHAPYTQTDAAKEQQLRKHAYPRLLWSGLAVFFVVQALLPFRHWVYPGDTNWTQEGFRFSWRVMLVESAGYTTFFVHDPATGKEWVVDPDHYLTVTQSRQMAFQPDMILEFAHYLEDLFREDGYADVEVRVEAYVSYNRRSSRLLIDPEADLTTTQASIWPKPWILDYGA